jgi:hypothetical protein
MIRFFKEIYLTWFVLIYRMPAPNWGNPERTKSVRASAVVTLITCPVLLEIACWIDMLIGKSFLLNFSYPVVGAFFVVLNFANFYVLVSRGYGIRFEREFNNLEKSRRNFLVTSCVVLLPATVAFFIYTISAYRHYFHLRAS